MAKYAKTKEQSSFFHSLLSSPIPPSFPRTHKRIGIVVCKVCASVACTYIVHCTLYSHCVPSSEHPLYMGIKHAFETCVWYALNDDILYCCAINTLVTWIKFRSNYLKTLSSGSCVVCHDSLPLFCSVHTYKIYACIYVCRRCENRRLRMDFFLFLALSPFSFPSLFYFDII